MLEHEISIKIDPEFKATLKAGRVEQIIKQILNTVNTDGIVELSVVFTNDKTIHDLNKKYRNIDNPTDVLAFQMHPGDRSGEVSFITPPDSIRHLGEVVISYPQASRQAEEYGHAIKHELKILLIHGILHLLGYDHERAEDEEVMNSEEEEIIKKLNSIGE
jgi:probable rRNA maturation factor